MALTAHTTLQAAPPRVIVDVAGAPEGSASIRILRIVSGDALAAMQVRGAGLALVGSAAQVTDWDVPTGVSVTWRVQALDANGSVLESADTKATVPDPSGSWCWLSDPLDATSPVLARLLVESDTDRTYQSDVSTVWSAGERLARAQVGARRDAPVHVEVCCQSDAECEAVERLLVWTRCVLLRPQSHLRLPPMVYGVAPEVHVIPVGLRCKGRAPHMHVTADLTPTRGPGRQAVVGQWSYTDTTTGTYRDSLSAYPTYRDRSRGL